MLRLDDSNSFTGIDVEKSSGPELRKRRASTGQMPPSKRSRANSSTGSLSLSLDDNFILLFHLLFFILAGD